jgi:hypothetical protein
MTSTDPEVVDLCVECPDPAAPPVPKPHGEGIRWRVKRTLRKYMGDWTAEQIEAGLAGDPYEVSMAEGNMLLNAGAQRILDQLIGATTSPFNNANARLCVGNSSTAESASQTDLQGAGKYYRLMDATYPSRAGQTVTWKATFPSGVAEFAWNEWGIDRGSASGGSVTAPMLNRKVDSMGTKGAGVTWTLQVDTTIS